MHIRGQGGGQRGAKAAWEEGAGAEGRETLAYLAFHGLGDWASKMEHGGRYASHMYVHPSVSHPPTSSRWRCFTDGVTP